MTTALTKSMFRPPPVNLGPVPKIESPGQAQIKPHNEQGIGKALNDFRPSPKRPGFSRILVTYRPRDSKGDAVNEGQAMFVDVYAIDYDNIPPGIKGPVDLIERGKWWFVERFASPSRIRLTLNDRTLFGAWVEPYVRAVFNSRTLKPSKRKMQTPLRRSSVDTGPDVVWLELAEFYGELGRMAGDPFYAELASELASLR